MAQQVSGFMTTDGKFFEQEKDAIQYEARQGLEAVLKEDDMSLDLIDWINNRRKELSAYLGITEHAKRHLPNSTLSRKLNSPSV